MKPSAGLLMFRRTGTELEIFLVHPGGPLWAGRNEGSWTPPKGEFGPEEEPLTAAKREFLEETGFTATGEFLELGSVRQKNGKVVVAWAFEGDCNPNELVSNTCEIEWPPDSGRRLEIPEVDKGRWFSIREARVFIRATHEPFLDSLLRRLG